MRSPVRDASRRGVGDARPSGRGGRLSLLRKVRPHFYYERRDQAALS